MKRGNTIAKDLYMLIISAVCVCALVFAWFNFPQQGGTDDLDFISIQAVGFEVSLDDVDYFTGLEMDYPKNLDMVPVSGDGELMYMPMLKSGSDNGDDALSWFPIDYSSGTEKNHFYRLHVYFRADVEGYVVLSDASLNPAAAPENRQSASYVNSKGNTVTVTGDVERPVKSLLSADINEDGTIITKDYIAAATRISITNTASVLDPAIARRFLVVPNAGFKLTANDIVNVNTGDVSYRLSMSENESPIAVQEMYHYYGGTKLSYGARDFQVYYDSDLPSSPVYVLRLFEETGSDGRRWYKGEIDICLWVEGFDEEACDFLAGGEVKMDLTFRYVESAPSAKGGE